MVKINMNIKKIKLDSNDFWPLINILNEVCHGIKISNFEKTIGVSKQTVIDFMNKISQKDGKEPLELIINSSEHTILKNSFDEVLRQIDDWEFQTRIGITILEAIRIREKF
jgi:hypothetical protein